MKIVCFRKCHTLYLIRILIKETILKRQQHLYIILYEVNVYVNCSRKLYFMLPYFTVISNGQYIFKCK